MKKKVVFILFLMLGLCFLMSYASKNGAIKGTVYDKNSNTKLINATVMLEKTRWGAYSDSNGNFFIKNVIPGTYNVSVNYMGYKKEIIENVTIKSGEIYEQNFYLSIDSSGTLEILVTSNEYEVDAKVTATTQSTSSIEMEESVVESVDDVLEMFAGVVDGHFRGGREDEAIYILDGANITDPVTGKNAFEVAASTIQNVEMVTGAYDAEYGGALSGLVQTTTKEGGDKFSFNAQFNYSGFGEDKFGKDFNKRKLIINSDGPLYKDYIKYFIGYEGLWEPSHIPKLPKNFSYSDDPFNTGETHKMSYMSFDPHFRDFMFFKSIDESFDAPYMLHHSKQDSITALWLRDYYRLAGGQSVYLYPSDVEGMKSYNNLYEKYVVNANDYIDNNSWSLTGKLNFDFISNLRFSLTGGYGRDVEIPVYYKRIDLTNENNLRNFKYLPWKYLREESENSRLSFNGSYVFSNKILLELNASFVDIDSKWGGYDYDNDEWLSPGVINENWQIEGSTYIPPLTRNIYGNSLSNYFNYFWFGGNYNFWAKRNTRLFNGKYIVTYNITKNNSIKIGMEQRNEDLKYHSFGYGTVSLQDFRGEVKDEINATKVSYFVQNQLNFNSAVIKIGVRADVFDSGEDNYYDPREGVLDVEKKVRFSPRFAVSHPLNDKSKIYFNYAHIYQIPKYEYMYSSFRSFLFMNYEDELDTLPGAFYYNPNLDPKKTIIYEIGVDAQLAEKCIFKFTGFYKEVTELVRLSTIQNSVGDLFSIFTNQDYGSVRGLETSINGEIFTFWNYDFNLSYQMATGTAANAYAFYGQNPVSINKKEYYLDFDRRFTSKGGITFKVPSDMIFDWTWIPNNWFLTLGYSYYTGLPYSKKIFVNGKNPRYIAYGEPNEFRMNDKLVFDLKLSKSFKIKNTETTFFLEIENLFDKKADKYVYSTTGLTDEIDINPFPVASDNLSQDELIAYYDRPAGFWEDYNLNIAPYRLNQRLNWYNINADDPDFILKKEAVILHYHEYLKYREERIENPYNYEDGREIRVGVKFSI